MEPFLTTIAIGLIISVVSGVIFAFTRWYLRRKDNKKEQKLIDNKEIEDSIKLINDEIIKIRKRVWRLEKNAIISSKIIDDQTEKYHPELISSLEDITNELLKESE